MTITNGYTTLANVQDMLSPVGLGTSGSVADNSFIERLVEEASRIVDHETGRQFFTTTETRYHDLPDDETLWLDGDLMSGCVINAGVGYSGSVLSWHPRNSTPKYSVEFKASTGLVWDTDANGDSDSCIGVHGDWGYTVSGSAPADIRRACEEITKSLYLSRAGQGVESDSIVTGAGVVVTPRAIPAAARVVLERYRKVNLGGE